jgi:hypothetical protein
VAYIILTFALDPMPESELYGHKAPSNGDLLAAVDAELASGERVCVKWSGMSPPTPLRCAAVFASCKLFNE